MSEWALFWGAAAMLLAAYALHGGWLAQRWGVDPSRSTFACQAAANQRHRWGAKPAVLRCVIASMWPVIMVRICGLESYGFAVCALCAMLCGGLSFAVLFVCVRTGMDLAQIAGEELFPDAKMIVYALTALTMITAAGMIVTVMTVSSELALWYSVVLWLMIGVTSVSQRMAFVIRSERHMQASAYGSAVCACVLALAWQTAIETQHTGAMPTLQLLYPFLVLLTVLISIGLGADAVHRMMKPTLPGKEKVPPFVWTLLCAAASIALAAADKAWIIVLSCSAGTICLLLAAATCAKWFHRIGRGLFSRN